jgi:hypothetical protein
MTLKEALEFVQPFAVILSSIVVPLLVAYFGNAMATANMYAENSVKYTELAISILRAQPGPESRPLREWAVDLLDARAPVKLSPAARAQLSERGLLTGSAVLGGIVASDSIHGAGSAN